MKKRLICAALVLVMLVPLFPLPASAAPIYDVGAALEFAKKYNERVHKDDDWWDCAQFVADCVIAGGLPLTDYETYSRLTGTGPCLSAIVAASGVPMEDFTSFVNKVPAASAVDAGDVLAVWCYTCEEGKGISPHVMICSGEVSVEDPRYAKTYDRNASKVHDYFVCNDDWTSLQHKDGHWDPDHRGHTIGAQIIRLSQLGSGVPVGSAPKITKQPKHISVPVNQTATFTVAASGDPAPTYQWQRKDSNGVWQNIAGATSSSFQAKLSYQGYERYRCAVSNQHGTVYSNEVTLNVMHYDNRYQAVVDILKETYPDRPQIANGFAGFWQQDKYSPKTMVAFAKASGDSQSGTTTTIDGKTYNGTDSYCFATSYAPEKLLGFIMEDGYGVNYDYTGYLDDPSWRISLKDARSKLTYGSVLTLVNANEQSKSIFFLCEAKNGKDFYYLEANYDDANGIRLGLGSWNGLEHMSYGYNIVTSYKTPYHSKIKPAYTSNVFQTAPKITKQPADVSTQEQMAASFAVAATGEPAPTFQWQQRASAKAEWKDIAGATGTTYQIASVNTSMNGMQFRCKITNAADTIYSDAATLSVAAKKVQSLSVVSKPKMEYTEGEKMDLSGLKLKVTYTNGTSETVSYNKSGVVYSVPHGTSLNADIHNQCRLIAAYGDGKVEVGELTVRRPYEIKSLTIMNGKEETLTKIPEGEFYVKVEVKKLIDREDAMVVLASYTKSGKLADLSFLVAEVPVGTSYALGTWVANPGGDIGKVKAFVVSSLREMDPVCPSREIG